MLKSISIQNYKNLFSKFEFNKSRVLIVAENGKGKTNLLEAIYFLTNGFDFRKTADSDSVNFEQSQNLFKISGTYLLESKNSSITEKEILFEMQKVSSKKFKVNDKTKTQIEFGKHSKAIIFAPESIDLISSSPEIRRLEIDHFCCLYFEEYSRLLIEFKQTLHSRNKQLQILFKRFGTNVELVKNDNIYKFWTTRFIDLSVKLTKFRLEMLKLLNEKCSEISNIYHFGENKFELNYNFKSLAIDEIQNFEEIFKAKLYESILKELVRGTSLYGPHRDDIEVKLNGKILREYGSRGQQRIASFMIKHAEVEILEILNDDNSSDNILLLDDLPSELDNTHLQNIEKLLEKMKLQIIMTATSAKLFSEEFLKNLEIIEL